LNAILHISRDWICALDANRHFTYWSPAVRELIGYEAAELLDRPATQVMDPGGPADVQRTHAKQGHGKIGGGLGSTAFGGVQAACRHRDCGQVWLEVSDVVHHAAGGRVSGYEGAAQALSAEVADVAVRVQQARARVERMLAERLLITAFQPIFDLDTGHRIGAEALTRFIDDPGFSPEIWFRDAETAGLVVELDLLAVGAALDRAGEFPDNGDVFLNVCPVTCLDTRLIAALDAGPVAASRIVVEITEHTAVSDYAPLRAALTVLRSRGVRIAVDDAGAGFASGRHIIQLEPDVIKIDRDIVSGIDTDPARRAVTAAMVQMAGALGATLVAEGIETAAELAAVTALGVTAGQGYLLGRPAVARRDWGPPHSEPILVANRARRAGQGAWKFFG
jgi:PAS domain S-box-containing protein